MLAFATLLPNASIKSELSNVHPVLQATTAPGEMDALVCVSFPVHLSSLTKDVDFNECAFDDGGCDPLTNCTNTDGSFICSSCPPGYDGNGRIGCTGTSLPTFFSNIFLVLTSSQILMSVLLAMEDVTHSQTVLIFLAPFRAPIALPDTPAPESMVAQVS